jgi:hypothetical protein
MRSNKINPLGVIRCNGSHFAKLRLVQ